MSTDPLKLQYPIVLIHGLGAKSAYGPIEYFYGLPKLLRNAKNEFLIANLTAWHTIEHRAQELARQINERFPEGKLNLVGHSMGGLDARYLTAQPEFKGRITSVTTIGTPNRGSTVGDIATGLVPETAFSTIDKLLKIMGSSSGGFKQITRTYLTDVFPKLAPEIEGVGYFSATSAIPNPIFRYSLPFFWLPHQIVKKYEGDNDGFVSVQSAMWGKHICTYPGDHYGQIGQFLGRSRGLDYVAFYNEIFKCLKAEGM